MFIRFLYYNCVGYTCTAAFIIVLAILSTIQPQHTILILYSGPKCNYDNPTGFNYSTYFINNKCYHNTTFYPQEIAKLPCLITMTCLTKVMEFNKLSQCWNSPKNGSVQLFDGIIHNYYDSKCQQLHNTIPLSRTCSPINFCNINSGNYQSKQSKIWTTPT